MRAFVVGLVLCLTIATEATAGPLRDGLSKYTTATQSPVYLNPSPGDGLIWGGLALAASGLVLEVVSYTAAQQTDITSFYYDRFGNLLYTYEVHANRGLLAGGLIIAVTGGVLMDIGFAKNRNARRPSLQFHRDGMSLVQSVRW